jgi:transposase
MRVIGKRYTEEFRSDAVNLVRRGDRSFKQVAEDLGVSVWSLRHWYNQEEMAKKPKKSGSVSTQRIAPADETPEQRVARLEKQVSKLQKENESLRTDREILKKAAAFFAKESE